MINEKIEIGAEKRKVGLNAATLPWWAKVLIVKHSHDAFPVEESSNDRPCLNCGRVMAFTKVAYQYFSNLCPECTQKNRSYQGDD
jgi:hypothetical protein